MSDIKPLTLQRGELGDIVLAKTNVVVESRAISSRCTLSLIA
jgi:hypothetical protein